MKKIFALLGLGLSISLGNAWAADASASANASAAVKPTQQNKMAACNQEAKEKALKGDARKAFMKNCLSAKPAAAEAAPSAAAPGTAAPAPAAPSAKTTQQEKMKACNKGAGEQKLKGEPRKAFMKDCLSK